MRSLSLIKAQNGVFEPKKSAEKWPFSHFSRFITKKATVIAVTDVADSLHMILAKLKRRLWTELTRQIKSHHTGGV